MDRLILRPPTEADAEAIYRNWATDPEVARYVMWRAHRSLDDTAAYMSHMAKGWESGAEFTWMICLKPSPEAVGAITLRKDGFKGNMGYVLARRHWNKGYMSEAGRAVVDLFFADPETVRVGAYCDIDNAASARVMEKMGMSREGVLKSWLVHPGQSEAPRDCLSYAITREEWVRGRSG